MISTALSEWIHRNTGVCITNDNMPVVTQALKHVADSQNLSPEKYCHLLLTTGRDSANFIHCVTTHESYFLRHQPHMDFVVKQLLPMYLSRGQCPHFLSLPCAQGEEPYSLLMLMQDAGLSITDIHYQAMDISGHSLQQARDGKYSHYALRKVPEDFIRRHFLPCGNQSYRLRDRHLNKRVVFSQGNLLHGLKGQFQVVFCHNLLIYFDRPTQKKALKVLGELLSPDGCLFVDPTEYAVASSVFQRQDVGQGFSGFCRTDEFSKRLKNMSSMPAQIEKEVINTAQSRAFQTAISRAATTKKTLRPIKKITKPPAAPRSASLRKKSLLTQAKALYRQKKFTEASDLFETVIREHPALMAEAHLGLANIFADQGDTISAICQAESALSSHPALKKTTEKAQCHAIIGIIYTQKKMTSKAREHLQKVAELDENHPAVFLLKNLPR
jgi:chemotaxis protein methyltransferase WspC